MTKLEAVAIKKRDAEGMVMLRQTELDKAKQSLRKAEFQLLGLTVEYNEALKELSDLLPV